MNAYVISNVLMQCLFFSVVQVKNIKSNVFPGLGALSTLTCTLVSSLSMKLTGQKAFTGRCNYHLTTALLVSVLTAIQIIVIFTILEQY